MMKFRIGQNKDGHFTWLSTPNILAHTNHAAEIEVGAGDKNEYKTIGLKVMPTVF